MNVYTREETNGDSCDTLSERVIKELASTIGFSDVTKKAYEDFATY